MRYHGPVMDESSSDALFPTDLPALTWQRFPAAGFSTDVQAVIRACRRSRILPGEPGDGRRRVAMWDRSVLFLCGLRGTSGAARHAHQAGRHEQSAPGCRLLYTAAKLPIFTLFSFSRPVATFGSSGVNQADWVYSDDGADEVVDATHNVLLSFEFEVESTASLGSHPVQILSSNQFFQVADGQGGAISFSSISDGTIRIVPEPSVLALLVGTGAIAVVRRRMRRPRS